MLLVETIRYCSTCSELTPHSRRRIALPKLLAALALAGAVWCARSGEERYMASILLGMGALSLVLVDRERFWSIRCERCRWKKRAADRETRRLSVYTIVDIY